MNVSTESNLKNKAVCRNIWDLICFLLQSLVSLKQLGIITQAITSWLYSSANYFSLLKDKCLYAFDHIVNLLFWKNLHIYSLIKIILETTIQTHKPCQMQGQIKYGFYKDKYCITIVPFILIYG